MRLSYFFVLPFVLSACATSTPTPSTASAPAASTATEKKAPQCWNGDLGQFQPIGTKASIAGVSVECKASADGKSAQWVGGKH